MSLADLTATELLSKYRDGSLSPVEVIEDVLARIEELEPRICATYALDPEGARAAARESERRWRDGSAGRLDGVPTTVKENIATRGTPVPQGTAATELVPATEDAPAAARLREAGAVIFCKTTMPEYGMLSSGVSTFHHLTRNPWDLSKTPGGSSAGAAAAAAAGYGPLHIGTDIGGSIRLPAGWCGVVGIKPTHGRVAVGNPYPGRAIGPLARTAADAALALSVMSGYDPRDHTSLPTIDDTYTEELTVQGLRVALLLDSGLGLPVDPEVTAAVSSAAAVLEKGGAIVEPIEPIITREMLDGLDRFWRVRSAADIAALPEDRRAKVLPEIRQWVSTAGDLSGFDVFHGYSQMGAMAAAVTEVFRSYDVILSPVAPITAFRAELAYPTDDPSKPFEHIAFTVPYNMSAHPATTVNVGWSASGLPIGAQLAVPHHQDLTALGLAAYLDTERREWPTA
ncbi:aspartyl-tRNA(Asn)/glutamyl-tRNA(Gln) amidotransferase subunit A [Kribbella steppae]|uniref:Aspartyl-tRNA(Asn)/glutamyl-tRNA(Gln) amidotransferase subunit A n=1 Tax=Kribbella steppae TaxID=2512223 RepID=A0A4R2HPL4_9ACTN|nr:amidase [Kribbella steppae]TCO32899.1 aspartyl-tRNA(Asn)/glutamyl-tRNA(Gln) amidotransferase subunit A [Kribbella steppae]